MSTIDGGIDSYRLALENNHGVCPDLELEVRPTKAGTIAARSTRSGESEIQVIGVGDLQLWIGRASDEVEVGAVVKPHSPGVVLQGLTCGNGALTLTKQRALGLVWQSTVEPESLAASVDKSGTGSVLVFSVDRQHLRTADLEKKGLGRVVRFVELQGACTVSFAPESVMAADGTFATPAKGAIERLLKGFVSA